MAAERLEHESTAETQVFAGVMSKFVSKRTTTRLVSDHQQVPNIRQDILNIKFPTLIFDVESIFDGFRTTRTRRKC